MGKYLKMVLFGALIWLVPYVLAMGLYPSGIMTANPDLFKNIMTISGSVTGLIAAVYYFKDTKEKKLLKEAIMLVAVWLSVCWVLDFAFLIPYTKQSLATYFLNIGISYIASLMPALAIALSKK